MIFGTFALPLSWNQNDISIEIEIINDYIQYERNQSVVIVKKTIAGTDASVLIHPIEPTRLPKPLTEYLMIELSEPLLIYPSSYHTVYLTFPTEIGVFLNHSKNPLLIDVLSLNPKKLTLYGEPSNGVICQFWKSDVFANEPEVNPLTTSILQFEIVNTDSNWVELKQVVLDTQEMKIIFDEKRNIARGKIKINDDGTAETGFESPETQSGTQKSIEVNKSAKIKLTTTRYLMENGL